MVKKLFALASVTALSGLVAAVTAAGCSSSELLPNADAGGDARREASRPPNTEESDSLACKAEGVFEPEALKDPAPPTVACTTAQIDALAAACATGRDSDPAGKDCKDAQAETANAGCAACIFGSDADAQWKVVNVNPAGSQRLVRYNQAGCIEAVSGVKGCGEELLTLNVCLNAYCRECTTEAQACIGAVIENQDECAPYLISEECYDAALGEGTDSKADAVEDCFIKQGDTDESRLFKYMATVACGQSLTDGGVDGGGDGGDGGGD